jgi:hypothetical protein
MFGLFGIVWLVVLVFMLGYCWKMLTDEKFLRKVIKWQNSMKGVKTEITPMTLRWTRLGAMGALIIGGIMIIGFFFNSFLFSFLYSL